MTRAELFALMHSPERIGGTRLGELRSLVDAYPYCASFVFVYLCALAKAQDVRYAAELRRLSIYLPHRGRLFDLVESPAYPWLDKAVATSEPQTDAFSLIDSYLEQAKARGADLPSELGLDAPVMGDYFAVDEAQAQGTESIPLEPVAVPATKPMPASLRQTNVDDTLSEDLFTETLARIYIQQGRYDKALRMIRSISLNYPKKNRYFAEQIRFLERLIQNNKE